MDGQIICDGCKSEPGAKVSWWIIFFSSNRVVSISCIGSAIAFAIIILIILKYSPKGEGVNPIPLGYIKILLSSISMP